MKTGFPGQKFNLRREREPGTGKGTRNRKRRPGLETGDAPVFLGTNPEQKTERKRGEISGSKGKGTGKGTGTKRE